jgi:hypothetical protein
MAMNSESIRPLSIDGFSGVWRKPQQQGRYVGYPSVFQKQETGGVLALKGTLQQRGNA